MAATTLADIVRQHATDRPERPAMRCGERTWTYAELRDESARVAQALLAEGVRPQERVAVLDKNAPEYFTFLFGAAMVNASTLAVNWRLAPPEMEYIINHAETRVLLVGEEFLGHLTKMDLEGVKHIVVLGEDVGAHTRYRDWIAPHDPVDPAVESGPEDTCYQLYTSGTTGLPKGVMHSHHTVFWANLTISATSDFRKGDVFLNALPLFHVGALTPVLGCVYGACTIVLLRAFDPSAAWDVIRDENVTTTLMVPAMLQFMLAVHDPAQHDASGLRWVMSGAAPVPISLIEAYNALDIEIHQVYGLTESCGPACVISSVDAAERIGSTGKSFFFTEVRVVDDQGDDVEPGDSGEVIVRGEHVMQGYWNRPDATAETIVDGWLHTGDVATIDADGYVTIVDRIKDMLISGGENVYPAEIENVLMAHEKIADAGIIGVPSDRWGESPLAVVVAKDDTLTAEEVMEFTRGRLAPFKTVKAVEFVTELPRNPSGKILKRELREQYDLTLD